MLNIAVIGCGPIGLCTATVLQQKLKNVDITIYTDQESPNTTGDVSAGFWTPYCHLVVTEQTEFEKIKKWSKLTQDFLSDLWKKGKAKEVGLSLVPVITLTAQENFTIPEWTQVSMGFKKLSQRQINLYSDEYKQNFTGGFSYVSFTWEPTIFLPFFTKKFIENGGTIIKEKITNILQLQNYDIIINCAGLGAKYLTNDPDLIPIRGQIQRVIAPWQFHAVVDDTNYILPNTRCVILGSTRQKDDYETSIRDEDKRKIVKATQNLVPSLKNAVFMKDMVGLRPGRNQVRLELEIFRLPHKLLPVIHNYGHGGSGVTLSYGCAEEAYTLTEQAMDLLKTKNKL